MAKTANYGVDIPGVLQRFSINFKPPDPGFAFFLLRVCNCACMRSVTATLVFTKQKGRRVRCRGADGGALFYLFFTFMCLWCARVCKFNVMLCQLKV